MDQEQLKKRSQELNRPFPIENVPFINYVDSKGDLKNINEKFDVILSCHSIEHQLDFIQHLQDVSTLLNDNGYYVIILPDKIIVSYITVSSYIFEIIDGYRSLFTFTL